MFLVNLLPGEDSYEIFSSKKIRIHVSCESSAWQRIHMKYQVLFSLKNNEKVFMVVVCCSCDWPFRVKIPPESDALHVCQLKYRRIKKKTVLFFL